jgi:hypothetical protein
MVAKPVVFRTNGEVCHERGEHHGKDQPEVTRGRTGVPKVSLRIEVEERCEQLRDRHGSLMSKRSHLLPEVRTGTSSKQPHYHGPVAELVDALDLGSSVARRPSSSLGGPRCVVLDSSPLRSDALRSTPVWSAPALLLDAVRAAAYNSRVDPDARGTCSVRERGSSSAVEHRLAKARVASSNLVFRSS